MVATVQAQAILTIDLSRVSGEDEAEEIARDLLTREPLRVPCEGSDGAQVRVHIISVKTRSKKPANG